MLEQDIEQALVRDVTKLLLELGTGFAFLGNQYHLNVGGDDFYIDLLFYNLNLRCYVVIELKTGDFKPGICRSVKLLSVSRRWYFKKRARPIHWPASLQKQELMWLREYSLKDISKPIGVSEYQDNQQPAG